MPAAPQVGAVPQLARNLQNLRAKRGITQEALAALLGVRQGQVSKWETGADSPRAEAIAGLALALRVSADDILRGLAVLTDGKIRMARPKRAPPEQLTAKARRASSA